MEGSPAESGAIDAPEAPPPDAQSNATRRSLHDGGATGDHDTHPIAAHPIAAHPIVVHPIVVHGGNAHGGKDSRSLVPSSQVLTAPALEGSMLDEQPLSAPAREAAALVTSALGTSALVTSALGTSALVTSALVTSARATSAVKSERVRSIDFASTAQPRPQPAPENDIYGALDLGTNNCRLLLARPSRRGFRVVDAFSRIIRLGEGVTQSGILSEPAMRRTMEALRVCAGKIQRHQVGRARLVATEACRVASNGQAFLDRVEGELGLRLEMLSRRDEARLAVAGCASLIDPNSEFALVFDIGGGSSELIWLDLTKRSQPWRAPFASRREADDAMLAWTSLPVGVVTLAETFGGREVTPAVFEAMVDHVTALLNPFEAEHKITPHLIGRRVHLLGTSGTVTTVAGILLGLARYDRALVDGCWLKVKDAQAVTYDLLSRTYEQRVAEPCIGRDRADLVLAGCAILEALLRQWPCENLRVADRGLREGILTTLMSEDGVFRPSRRRRGTRPD